MNLKQFRSKGGTERWAKMTDEQKKAHIQKMSDKSRENRAKNKAKTDLSTVV